MKKLTKISSIFTLLAVFLACLGIMINVNIARATEPAEITPATAEFKMDNGASLRLMDGSNGMRFTASLSSSDYTAIEGAGASYGMLIMPAEYVSQYGDLTAENVFGASPKYDYAVLTDGEWVYTGDNTTVKRIINIQYDELDTNEKGDCVIRGSIVDVNSANITRAFIGRAYIRYGEVGSYQYEMADYVSDNILDYQRSMYQVAKAAIADNSEDAPSTEEKETLSSTYVTPYEVTVGFNADNGTEIIYTTMLKGDTIDLPADPVKEGYKFKRWVSDDWKFDWSTEPINNNMTLTAKYAKEDTFIDTDSTLMSYLNTGNVKWVESVDGEQGVIQITRETAGEGGAFNRNLLYPAFNKEYYAQYDAILVKAKASVTGINLLYGSESPWSFTSISSNLSTDWAWYVLDKDFLMNNYDAIDATNMLYWSGSAGTVWISEFIGYKNPTTPENSFIDTDKAVKSQSDQYVWHKEFDGETGVIQATITSPNSDSAQWLNFEAAGFSIANAKTYYDDYDMLVFKMKAGVTGISVTFANLDDWKLLTVVSNLSTEWTTYKIALSEVLSFFDKFDYLYVTGAKDNSFYIADIYVEKTAEYETPTNAWLDTDNPINSVNGNGNAVWHEIYDGENGVIELKVTGEGFKANRNFFGPAFEKAHYEGQGYTKLVFKVKASVTGINIAYGSESPWSFVSVSGNVATTWTEYELDLATILSNYDGIALSNGFYCVGNGLLYIADVYVK